MKSKAYNVIKGKANLAYFSPSKKNQSNQYSTIIQSISHLWRCIHCAPHINQWAL